jgi:hypothetical protein
MPRTTLALTSFVSGEFSPKMDGRSDFDKYSSGTKTLENFLIHPQGAATRRVGTQFIAEVKDSTKKTRLIPFEFSTTQTYILEFGDQYIRFFKDKGQITESTKTITGITQANPAVVTSATHGYSNGDFIIITSVVGMTQVNGVTFKVANQTTNTFELQTVNGTNINSTAYTAYSSAGDANRIYQISTPYLEAELFDIKFAQSADVMYIVHPNHETNKLSRTGHTSWSLNEVVFTDGPYLAPNTTAIILTPSATSGSGITITASTNAFVSTDVNRLVSFSNGYARITAFNSATNVTADVEDDFDNTTATTDWKLGAFSDTTGHPSCVSFFEQRLVFAGTISEPQTLYFSKAGDYENMTAGTNADDAMVYTIASNQVNAIRYMKAVRTLVVGTTGGEFTVSADGTDAAVTPTNVTIKRQSSFGAANVDAIPAGNAILFLQKAKRKIRELQYNFDSDGYQAADLCILNDTVTKSGINEMVFQQEPDSIIWCVRDDGVLAGLTYQRSENVVAWHRHIFGGSFGSGNAVCETAATISGTLTEDELWVIVKRTINGSTKRYIECFSDFDFDETDATDFKFLDSHLSYSGASTTTLSGLSHLEGQTVSVLADGSVHANKTVSSGSITLDRAVTKACVGLPYNSVLQTMRIEGGAAEGTSQGKTKRISKVVLRLFETVGVKVGPSLTDLETVPFRTTSSALSSPVDTLLAGDKEIEFRDDYNSDGFIFVKQDQPLPCSILAIYPTLVTSDG